MYNITFKNSKNGQKYKISNIPCANSFIKRLLGLMGKENFKGLIFKQKKSGKFNATIHTCLMKKSIDIIYINQNMKIEEIKTLKPWKLYIPKNEYIKYIIELPENSVSRYNLKTDTQVVIEHAHTKKR